VHSKKILLVCIKTMFIIGLYFQKFFSDIFTLYRVLKCKMIIEKFAPVINSPLCKTLPLCNFNNGVTEEMF